MARINITTDDGIVVTIIQVNFNGGKPTKEAHTAEDSYDGHKVLETSLAKQSLMIDVIEALEKAKRMEEQT